MKFECNCKTDRQLKKLMDAIHVENSGFNFEVVARLWYTPVGSDKSIMVEHQVATQTCRELTENADEPDWFTAYEVDDEQDCDCSAEIFTETADNYISVLGLKEAMCEFAKAVEQRFFLNSRASIDEQIKSASSRAAESQPMSGFVKAKESNPER